MAAEFHQRVRQLFDQALERPEAERKAFVENASAGDINLLEAVQRLIRARAASESFLESTIQDTGQIGRYVIRGELGRGSMGIVYDAVDPMIGRRVAVKVISLKAGMDTSQAEFMKERLFREARSAGRLFHPGIVVIFDVGLHGDSAFITMECVEGQSLQQLLATGGALAPQVALSILKQTASALDYAHRLGVVHRDIKPANIMLHGDITVKVADFGIAKLMSTQNATVTGLLMGTPSYMSPEQIEGLSVNGQSDQFSLAILAYELLTGVRPFEADSMPTLAHLIVYGPRPSAHAANTALPREVDRVLERALSRFPSQRFSNCTEFTGALDDALLTARIAALPKEVVRRRAGKPVLYLGAFAALILVALIVGAGAAGNYKNWYSRKDASLVQTSAQVAAKSYPPAAQRPAPPPQLLSRTAAKLIPATSGNETVTSMDRQPKRLSTSAKAELLYEDALEKRRQSKVEEAVALFQEAANLGDTNAMKELAESFSAGEGVSKDGVQAEQWFVRAAAGGNSAAMVSLGALYLLSEPPNFDEAARWFQKAADRDNPDGIYNLGPLYENGEGVARDMQKARQLYQEAAALGNSDAKRRLAQLAGQK
jgi:serine/threonine protein kinase